MNDTEESSQILQELCSGQPLAVLATDAGAGPYASLVAVAVTPDGKAPASPSPSVSVSASGSVSTSPAPARS